MNRAVGSNGSHSKLQGAMATARYLDHSDKMMGVRAYKGKQVSCNECSTKAPLRKAKNGYLCESHFKKMLSGAKKVEN